MKMAWANLSGPFKLSSKATGVERKIKKAVRAKKLPKKRAKDLIDLAVEKGIISKEEQEVISKATAARWDAIQVDDFKDDEYKAHSPKAYTSGM